MIKNLVVSPKMLVSILNQVGYKTTLTEEIQYRIGPDQSCEPFILSRLHITLSEENIYSASEMKSISLQ